MHYIAQVANQVEKTHPNMSRLFCMTMLATKAHKVLLLVSPRGCGKSTVTNAVGMQAENWMEMSRVSAAGIGAAADDLSGFTGAIIVDDIAKAQSNYARISTITTLTELNLAGNMKSTMQGSDYQVTDFKGAVLINIQPVLLKALVESDEWEASVQDKTTRYYHVYRPVKPSATPPDVRIDWGLPFDKVSEPNPKGKMYQELVTLGSIQWTLARVNVHVRDYLKAAAALDHRKEVTQSDYRILRWLMKPLAIESLVTSKRQLESERFLDSNALSILVEYASHGNFTLGQLCSDYRVSPTVGERIMGTYPTLWQKVSGDTLSYRPTDAYYTKLKQLEVV